MMRTRVALAVVCLPFIACGGSPAAPDSRPPSSGVQHVYVTWTTGDASPDRWRINVPDAIVHSALSKLEASAGGALVIHRQQVGTPLVRIRLDNSLQDQGNRGLSWATGPCTGEIAMESSAVGDDHILLHELGHIFIAGPHSPYPEDILLDGLSLRPFDRPTTYSPRESQILRGNLASGCARLNAWS